jgi:SAM-dependent methyltransferase
LAEKRYLMTPGPTPVPPEVLRAMALPIVHHRGPDFKPIYARTLERLIREGVLQRGMSVLVVCGGTADRDVFQELGFEDVTVSNLADDRADYAPYRFRVQDAEELTYDEGSFDLVAVSGGLHHCRSPHRALLEMYRVARRAIFVLEARDSVLMRAGARLGVVDDYEVTAVAAHGFRAGGVRHTSAPNFVYRWTEREVEKTIASNAPHARHRIRYFHELELPLSVLEARHGRLGGAVARVAEPALRLVTHALPSQANLFAFLIEKPRLPDDLQPWMRLENEIPVADEHWIRARTAVPTKRNDRG